MPSPFERGRSAEYRVKDILKDQGYLVLRSAASHTPIDLLAAKSGERLAIQVKVRGKISKEERNELLKWAREFDAKPILARRRRNRWVLEELTEPPPTQRLDDTSAQSQIT
ncbi:MAG: hypothetical protein QXP38_05580 [Nitrososphaerota archaeon]